MKSDQSTSAKESLPLVVRLRERIKQHCAINFCDWMNASLYEEPDGYYVRDDKILWGRKGDYRTAPETSPLFASTFTHYFAKLFEELNEPNNFTIIECGAGNGSFAFECLRTLQTQFPSLFNKTKYLIDEISKVSQKKIRGRLNAFEDKFEFISLKEISKPFQNAVIFSNELIDAFPVHRVVMRDGELKEIYVDVNDEDDFVFTESQISNPRLVEYLKINNINLAEGQLIEINLSADDWLKHIAKILKNGFVITVDYGADAETLYDFNLHPNGTLRAFSKHQFVDDYLSCAGKVDLTTTVNWSAFQRIGKENGLETISLESLDKFLLRVGLLEQLEIAGNIKQDESEKISLRTSIKDLILPNGFGTTHQVLVQKK